MAYLYDLPVEFYVYGCTTGGSFDPAKALDRGYNEGQLSAIEQFLADNPEQVKAALANMTEAEPAEEAPTEEPPAEG